MDDGKPLARDKTKQLGAWFLGPKAENAGLEEDMLLHILRDYFYWRRNYYPSDEIIITQLKYSKSALNFKIIFHTLTPDAQEIIYDDSHLTIETIPLSHKINCSGFLIREKVKPRRIDKNVCRKVYHIPKFLH